MNTQPDTRPPAEATAAPEWLDQAIARLPRAADEGIDRYLALLGQSLTDGRLEAKEKKQLAEAATAAGLTSQQIHDLHVDYVRALVELALEDHVLSSNEDTELRTTAGHLGVSTEEVDQALEEVKSAPASRHAAMCRIESAGLQLQPGDCVAFTGDSPDTALIELARSGHGLVVGPVGPDTVVAVAADVNSLSSRASEASSRGIALISQDTFRQLLNSMPRR